ncbi:MAG: DUF1573 domain-containing protein [Pirellulales bacterium]
MIRSRNRSALLGAAALFPLVALAAGLRWYGEPAAPGRNLQINPALLSLGEVAARKDHVVEIPVVNRGDEEVAVASVSTSCVCTRVEPASFRVPAGESVTLRVHLDLSPKSSQDLAKATRDVAHELKFELAGENSPGPSWVLQGRVINPYEVSPGFAQFAEQLVEGRAFEACELTVKGRAKLHSLEARCDARWAAVQALPQSDGSYRLRIQPNSALPVGEHQFEVDLVGSDASGQLLAEQPVPVLAHVVSDVMAFPRALSYGLVALEEDAEGEIVFSSRSGLALELVDVQVPAGLEVGHLRAESRVGALAVRLAARPSKAGLQSGLVTFVLQDAAGKRHEVSLRTSLEARPPDAVNAGVLTLVSR